MQKGFDAYADKVHAELTADAFLNCFKPLNSVVEMESEWIVQGWMPADQITLLAADGGIGKTSIWINLLSSLSSGTPCMLDPPDTVRNPMTVAFCTTEDSVAKKLKRKLREAGANEANIITMDTAGDKGGALRDFKFGSSKMDQFIRHFRPKVCVFDPVQGFIPPDINMGSRNAMRDCMAPLITLGEEVGTAFLVICHTNKRKGASGRDRIADSADLWDISRSVWMAGYTEEQGIRYLSNEKNNYTLLQETRLFCIDDSGQIQVTGTSFKRDRDFMADYAVNTSKPKLEECKDWVLRKLEDSGEMNICDLNKAAMDAGYSSSTLRRAKKELTDNGEAKVKNGGFADTKFWSIYRSSPFD